MKLSSLTLSVCKPTTMSTDSITCYTSLSISWRSVWRTQCVSCCAQSSKHHRHSVFSRQMKSFELGFFSLRYFYSSRLIDFSKILFYFERSLLKLVPGSLPSRKPSIICFNMCRYGSAWFWMFEKNHLCTSADESDSPLFDFLSFVAMCIIIFKEEIELGVTEKRENLNFQISWRIYWIKTQDGFRVTSRAHLFDDIELLVLDGLEHVTPTPSSPSLQHFRPVNVGSRTLSS